MSSFEGVDGRGRGGAVRGADGERLEAGGPPDAAGRAGRARGPGYRHGRGGTIDSKEIVKGFRLWPRARYERVIIIVRTDAVIRPIAPRHRCRENEKGRSIFTRKTVT